MITKSIIASLLVLGTTTAAFAAPCETPAPVATQPQPVYQQPVYEQPVYQQPVYQQPVYQGTWTQPAPQPVAQPVYQTTAFNNEWNRAHDRGGFSPAPVVQQVVSEPTLAYPLHRQGWVTVTNPMRLAANTTDRIGLGSNRGAFTMIELRSAAGTTSVGQVTIEYPDHTTQVVNVNQMLSARNPTVKIDLNGNARHIQSVSITGTSTRTGSIQLLAAQSSQA